MVDERLLWGPVNFQLEENQKLAWARTNKTNCSWLPVERRRIRVKAKSRKISMTEYQADLYALKVISYCELWKAKSVA
jgi:hypothetical protein